MTVIINPGSGPVEGTLEAARVAVQRFADDLAERGHTVLVKDVADQDRGDDRFSFAVHVDGVEHEVDMPGLPIERVRYVDREDQNIWDFPRLYVDGSSWVWMYALNVCEPDDDDG